MSHTSFESFFASQGPKHASKEPILSARNGKKKRNEAWNWMKSKDNNEIFHHHLFSAKTQLTIVNFFKRRVGKTFSPATFLPSESQSNSMHAETMQREDQGFLKLAGQQGCVCHLSWSLRPTLTSPERWQLNISTIGAQLLWQGGPQGDHIELMFRQHHQDKPRLGQSRAALLWYTTMTRRTSSAIYI